jgi:multisubunit Na+/H+ antiporter MnhB subunit
VILDDRHRRPQTFGGAVYLGVLGLTLVGLVITIAGAWRTGVSWIGSGLVLAAAARLVLPEHRAGMLRVRRKSLDVAMLALAGVALIVLAIIVPNQPGALPGS